MSVAFQWTNPQRTALTLTFAAPWTWDEFERVSPKIEQEFATVDHPVDLLIDLRDAADTVPDGSMVYLRDAYADGLANLREYVFIGAPEAFKMLFMAVDRYYTALGGRLAYRFADAGEWRDLAG